MVSIPTGEVQAVLKAMSQLVGEVKPEARDDTINKDLEDLGI